MSATEESQKCGQKMVLSLFFIFELIAYVFSCVALISPSWQYVYLENGRTEHHHGLWLDCKRDYSHDYGRSREYYETLYRLNKQVSPFDQFFLTSLLCVYKFDYYIDSEDLYDHNHDENRLQDDANQHLMLGWKIASLIALGFAVITSSVALLISVFAFCHRTLICCATVLITAAALLSSVGLLIFLVWANYQDNSIIKEDDGIYEQCFGWALYVQIAGTAMQFLASFIGCAVTSMAFKKSHAKLVKIEVVDRDSSTLLDRTGSPSSKHSAVYKLDSADLQKWEEDYTNMIQSNGITKRHASAPNFKKRSRKSHHNEQRGKITKSISNLFTGIYRLNSTTASETFSSTAKVPQLHSIPVPKSILKASSKQNSTMSNTNRRLSDDDLTYEYLPADCIRNSRSVETLNKLCTTNFVDSALSDQITGNPSQQNHSGSSMNVYDKVYEHISNIAESKDCENANSYKSNAIPADRISVFSERGQVCDKDFGRSTLINDVPSCSTAITTRSAFTNPVLETITMPMKLSASAYTLQNLPLSSNNAFIAPRRTIDERLVEPNASTQNFFMEQNAGFQISNGHSLDRVLGGTTVNKSSLETLAGTERERCSQNDMDRFVGSLVPKSRSLQNKTQLCLNLFMNTGVAPLLPVNKSSTGSTETKKSSITTV